MKSLLGGLNEPTRTVPIFEVYEMIGGQKRRRRLGPWEYQNKTVQILRLILSGGQYLGTYAALLISNFDFDLPKACCF